MSENHKILLCGIDNAGKSSIITSLMKKFNYEKEISNLKPTIKINYHKFNYVSNTIFIWDMGGQSAYRNLYLSKFEVYFSQTDLLIFVIDIQDKSRFSESLVYLDLIIKLFNDDNINIPILIDFHKHDPILYDDNIIASNIEFLKAKIKERYEKFSFYFLQSSIFDILSIIKLISFAFSFIYSNFPSLFSFLEY